MGKTGRDAQDEGEIMPPETGDVDAARGADGARQLPPLIDQADGGVLEIYLIRPIQKFIAAVTLWVKRLLRATFWSGLAIAFIYVGLLIWQINRPTGDWASGKRDWQALLTLSEIQILAGLKTADRGASPELDAGIAEISDAVAVDEEVAVLSDLPALPDASVAEPNIEPGIEPNTEPGIELATEETNNDATAPAGVASTTHDADLRAEQAAHQATKAALLAAQDKLSQLRLQREDRGVAKKRTSARANLAELILRLDHGADFSVLLANARADGLLTDSEVTALVPFAETGVNWSALIRADYQRLKRQLTLIEPAPETVAVPDSPPPVLSWLHEWSRGLVSLQRLPEAPLVVAGEPALAQIEMALAGQQYEVALALLAQPEIVTLMPAAPMPREQAMTARQELNARLTQAARHQQWLAQLKQDLLMGQRP
jgi:hypothetical protein